MACQCTAIMAGYLAIAFVIYRLINSIYKVVYPFFIASPLDLHEAAGAKWAAVTGCTDGIGKAYAEQLAKRKFNLMLLARSSEKLEAMKKELVSKFGIEVEVVVFDFSTGDHQLYEKNIAPRLATREIGILVNNVGLSYEYPEVLHKVDGGLSRLRDISVVNILPTTLLTHLVLSQMVDRNRGIVINVGSAASYNQMAMWAVYSASKKYVQWLSSILRLEYHNTRIIVQSVCPMVVATKMSKVSRPSFFSPGPEQFVASALRTVGLISETTGFFSHQIQAEVMNWLPSMLINAFLTKQSVSLRERALRKRIRDEKKTE